MGITKASGVTYFFIFLILAAILVWNFIRDTASCSIQGAGIFAVDGYYAAYDGIYLRKGNVELTHAPDFFQVAQISRTVSVPASMIRFQGVKWDIVLSTQKGARVAYTSRPEDPEENILRPPSSGWVSDVPGLGPTPPSAVSCSGDLPDSDNGQLSPTDNIEKFVRRPVTTLLLFVNLGVAYYLWMAGIEVSAVSFSYDAVSNGSYWRMVSASFSHFDLMHIGFNMMSLYQLGDLELVYGSAAFLYLNIDLVFITMIICLAISYLRMKYFGHDDLQYQQSIGFSCVLFAWMVAASVRMNQYCPLFFMPSLCFDTWHINIPVLDRSISLPVNLGPFVLLVVTKLILPRTSLVGHFSGIVIGFPLAWNLINWMTPDVLCLYLLITLCFVKNMWPWTLSGYSTISLDALADCFPANGMDSYNHLKMSGISFILLSVFGSYVNGLWSFPIAIHLALSMCCYFLHHILRCLWLSELRSSKQDCLVLLGCVAGCITVSVVCDVLSIVSSWAAKSLLILSCKLPLRTLVNGEILYASYLIIEVFMLALLLKVLNLTPEAKYYLKAVHCDDCSLRHDVDYVGTFCGALSCGRICVSIRGADTGPIFQGTGRVLRSDSPQRDRNVGPAAVASQSHTGGDDNDSLQNNDKILGRKVIVSSENSLLEI